MKKCYRGNLEHRKPVECLFLLLIVLFGYLLRIIVCFNATVSRDGITYIRYVIGWEKSGTLSLWHINDTILFIALLKPILKFGVNPVIAGFSLNIVLGACFIVLTFLFVERLTGNSIASLLCAFLMAVHPTFIILSADVLRENLFLCLSALSLISVFADKKNGLRLAYIIAAAFFTSCAALTRAEGVLILPLLIMCIWLRHNRSFALLKLSIYLLLSGSLYLVIVQCIAPEHRINILERTVNFIF